MYLKKAYYKTLKKCTVKERKEEKEKMKKDKKQVFYNLYMKDEEMGIRPINEFTSYKDIEKFLNNNYNVKTTKQMIYNSLKYNAYINDLFVIYKD